MLGSKINLTLAQWAQVHPNGTVNLGGGYMAVVPYEVPGHFIAGNIMFGWDAIGAGHTLSLQLLDAQDEPVIGNADEPVTITMQFPIAPFPGVPWGTPLSMPIVLPVGPMTLDPASLYEWRYQLDGEQHEDWALSFSTMPEAQPKAA